MESVQFKSNNFVRNFPYPQSVRAYKEICKFLMNYPLDEAYTKTPSILYQNYLGEFWCTVVAADPNPPIDSSKARPLKEFIIKFTVMNGQRPLTLDYKTFCESTRLDYNKGNNVDIPLLRILLTFVVQVLSGNYSSTEQLNSIHQLLAYSLLTGTKVDKGGIIFSDLVTRLTDKSRKKHISYPRFVSYALEVLLGSDYAQDQKFGSLPNALNQSKFIKDPSKETPIVLTALMIEDTEGNTQPIVKGSYSPLGEGTHKSKPLPESKPTNLKDSKGNKLPADMGFPATHPYDGTSKTQPLLEGINTDPKDSKRLKPLADRISSTPLVTALSGTYAEYQVDKTQSTRFEVSLFTSLRDVPESSKSKKTYALDSESSSCSETFKPFDNYMPITERQLEKHKEVDASYADLRATIEEYAEVNADHRAQTDTTMNNTMNHIDKINNVRVEERYSPLKSLNRVSETLEADSALKALMIKMAETNTTTSSNISKLTKLLRNEKNTRDHHLIKCFLNFPQHFELSVFSSSTPSGSAINATVRGEFTEIEPEVEDVEKEPEATNEEEHVQEPQLSEPIPITIVRPLTKPAPELEIIRSSSRLQITYTILEVVHEEATKDGVDLKVLASKKGGQE
ncbi:hypothetical protein Tco_1275624 [Tanacetum coccineum]